MDSVSQAALGAAVGVAVMGRRMRPWQAALAGAFVGTLPDLDVFIDKGDAVRDMVLHRAETHALFYQALASPLIAGALAWTSRTWSLFGRWCVLVVLGLFTHSLLDAMTIYGTRLGLPFTDYPFGAGSLFIIDPLYTLPLLLGVVVALSWNSPHRLRWNTAGLVLSSLYAGWSLVAQAHVTERVAAATATRDVPASHILVTPSPFNTLLWRVVVVEDEVYHEGHYSLFDRDAKIRLQTYNRGTEFEPIARGFEAANLVREFSKGFYALSDVDGILRVTDLRMGQYPSYVFSFGYAEHQSEPLVAIEPVHFVARVPIRQGLVWLGRRIRGENLPPPGVIVD